MMKIPDKSFTTEEIDHNNQILETIKKVLAKHDFVGVRADHKDYHPDVLPNVMTYMEGSGFGIAVYIDDHNPNVSLEVGYMLANSKPICFLKGNDLGDLHIDIISKLYKNFDSEKPIETIDPILSRWLTDTLR